MSAICVILHSGSAVSDQPAAYSAGRRITAREANGEILAFAMIETGQGMSNLEAIAATPGLDGIYVGPADLTLGLPGPSHPGF